MTSYIPPTVYSVLPRWSSPTVATFPEIGSKAPTALSDLDLPNGTGNPALVAFVRHCGCPFAEKEVKILGEALRKHQDLRVVIVQHSEEKETKEWFDRIGGPKFMPSDPKPRYTLLPDPDRSLYAAWGIGQLGWTGMINSGVMSALKALKESDGIDLTETGKGSYRWQNSGGFAIDSNGVVRWSKLAKDSSDMCDYLEAASTVV